MIRINLLPEAKRGAATGGNTQTWAVIYLLSCLAWAVVLVLFYLNKHGVLEEQNAKNDELQGLIDRAKSQSENIGDVEAKLAKSKQLEEVVGGLQAARQGPARVLMELSRILSEGGGPSIPPDQLDALRRENPLLVYNPGWDVRRLWIDQFDEVTRRVTVTGSGKTNEDIAEFLRRLNISETFDKVTLKETNSTGDSVHFVLTCEVKY